MAFRCPDEHRDNATAMRLYGWSGDATCGVYRLPSIGGRVLHVIASSGAGWEHVSVSCRQGRRNRTPNWAEMCRIKAMFWGPEDCVVQFHPPESEYVRNAEALHLWRPIGVVMPRPASGLVGVL